MPGQMIPRHCSESEEPSSVLDQSEQTSPTLVRWSLFGARLFEKEVFKRHPNQKGDDLTSRIPRPGWKEMNLVGATGIAPTISPLATPILNGLLTALRFSASRRLWSDSARVMQHEPATGDRPGTRPQGRVSPTSVVDPRGRHLPVS
jgi:hypothetical protein